MNLHYGYDVGDRVTVTTTFTDPDGVPTSPTAIYADCRRPGDTAATELAAVDEGSGVVTFELPVFDVPGGWLWYVKGTQGIIAADQGGIRVDRKLT